MSFSRQLSVGLQPPSVPSGVYLPPMFSIIEPTSSDIENMINNPSFERTPVVNWAHIGGAGSIDQDFTTGFKGHYCCRGIWNPGESAEYGSATPLSLIAGTTYVLSAYVRNPVDPSSGTSRPGVQCRLAFTTTGGVVLVSKTFVPTNIWQRFWIHYTETATTTRRILIGRTSTGPSDALTILVDAVQVEAAVTGRIGPTTYIDGDQVGIIPGETPASYFWTGTPHASTSVRRGLSRAGGYVVRLDKLGFQLLGIEGLGSSEPDVQTIQYAELDGEILSRVRKPARDLSLIGRFDEGTFRRLRARSGDLASLLDRDLRGDGVTKILFQPMDEYSQLMGEEFELVGTYTGGLGDQINNFNTDVVTLGFRTHEPNILSVRDHSTGAIAAGTSFTHQFISSRTEQGIWDDLAGGVAGGYVKCILPHPNGLIFVGGTFTSAGASGADKCAIYNPVTDTWSNINSSDTTFNGDVEVLALGESENVYIGGNFTNAGGVANADRICVTSGLGTGITALGTGMSTGRVHAIKRIGTRIYVGGSFTDAGGVANTNSIAYWNLTTSLWTAMGTGVSAGNGIFALDGISNKVVVGGTFTGMSGVSNTTRLAQYSISANTWSAMGTGADDTVHEILLHPKTNFVYIGGEFTTLGGITAHRIGIWNDFTYEPVGPSTTFVEGIADLFAFALDLEGDLWVGGTFTTLFSPSIGWTQGGARLAGSAWVSVPFSSTFTPVLVLTFSIGGRMYIGTQTGGATVFTPVQITINNTGSARTYPIVRFTSDNQSRIFSFENLTTRKRIYWNLTLALSEILEVNFDPVRLYAKTSVLSSVSGSILPGSNTGEFYLQPGVNVLEFLITVGGTLDVRWQEAHGTLDTTWHQAITRI